MTRHKLGRWRRLSAVGVAITLGVACSQKGTNPSLGTTPSIPTSPTIPVVPVPPSSYDITARVADTAYRSIGGARVEVIDGDKAGRFCETDSDGQCSISGVSGAYPSVRVSKDGYISHTFAFSAGLNVFLYPAFPPTAIAGTYTLTVKASSTCTELPLELSVRRYTAMITQADPFISVDLTNDADVCRARKGLSACGFFGGMVLDTVGFSLFNDGIGAPAGTILEALGSGKWFTAQGIAHASMVRPGCTHTAPRSSTARV